MPEYIVHWAHSGAQFGNHYRTTVTASSPEEAKKDFKKSRRGQGVTVLKVVLADEMNPKSRISQISGRKEKNPMDPYLKEILRTNKSPYDQYLVDFPHYTIRVNAKSAAEAEKIARKRKLGRILGVRAVTGYGLIENPRSTPRRTKGVGEFYADYDDDSGLWCVFHTENGHAYSSWSSREEAEEDAGRRNRDDRNPSIGMPDSLQEAKYTILSQVRSKRPYWNNIVSLTLQHIAKTYGNAEANKLIRECGLKKLGWSEEAENPNYGRRGYSWAELGLALLPSGVSLHAKHPTSNWLMDTWSRDSDFLRMFYYIFSWKYGYPDKTKRVVAASSGSLGNQIKVGERYPIHHDQTLQLFTHGALCEFAGTLERLILYMDSHGIKSMPLWVFK